MTPEDALHQAQNARRAMEATLARGERPESITISGPALTRLKLRIAMISHCPICDEHVEFHDSHHAPSCPLHVPPTSIDTSNVFEVRLQGDNVRVMKSFSFLSISEALNLAAHIVALADDGTFAGLLEAVKEGK